MTVSLGAAGACLLSLSPALAQLDFWNKPKPTVSSRAIAMELCLKELGKRVREMRSDPDSILQSYTGTKIVYKDSYCKPRQLRFKDVGMMFGKVVYTQEDVGYPDSLEVKHITVLYGEKFPW